MPYATAEECLQELKGSNVLTSTTDVKAEAFGRFLYEADAEINSYIGARYVLPVSGEQSLQLLRKLEIDIVTYRYAKIKDITAMQPLDQTGRPTQKAAVLLAYEKALQTLKCLRDGTMVLPDVPLPSGAAGGVAYVTSREGPYDPKPVW